MMQSGMGAHAEYAAPPDAPGLRRLSPGQQRGLLIGAVAAAVIFVALAVFVRSAGLIPLDAGVQHFMQDQRSPAYERPLRIVTEFGSGWVLLPATSIGCAVVALRYRRLAVAFALTAVGTMAIMGIAKGVVGRPRPNVWGYAYPSGHVLGVVVFCGVLLYALWLFRVSRVARMVATTVSVVVVLAVGVSRLYVKTHWFTDVVGGVAAGLAIALAVAVVIDRHLSRIGMPIGRAGLDLAHRIETTDLQTKPFDHIYLRDIFPSSIYEALQRQLPATDRYRELRHREAIRRDGTSARRKFYLFPEHVMLLPAEQRAFWLPIARELRSPEVHDAFKRRFRDALERRFGTSIDRLSFYPVPMLLRDFGGYRIGIHGDSMSKAITAQIYLPPDASQAHLGTLLHEGRNGEAAARVVPLEFLPATGYAFPVIRHESWHSVAQTSEADGERNSLMLSYYVQGSASDWVIERCKRWWLFAVYGFRR